MTVYLPLTPKLQELVAAFAAEGHVVDVAVRVTTPAGDCYSLGPEAVCVTPQDAPPPTPGSDADTALAAGPHADGPHAAKRAAIAAARAQVPSEAMS